MLRKSVPILMLGCCACACYGMSIMRNLRNSSFGRATANFVSNVTHKHTPLNTLTRNFHHNNTNNHDGSSLPTLEHEKANRIISDGSSHELRNTLNSYQLPQRIKPKDQPPVSLATAMLRPDQIRALCDYKYDAYEESGIESKNPFSFLFVHLRDFAGHISKSTLNMCLKAAGQSGTLFHNSNADAQRNVSTPAFLVNHMGKIHHVAHALNDRYSAIHASHMFTMLIEQQLYELFNTLDAEILAGEMSNKSLRTSPKKERQAHAAMLGTEPGQDDDTPMYTIEYLINNFGEPSKPIDNLFIAYFKDRFHIQDAPILRDNYVNNSLLYKEILRLPTNTNSFANDDASRFSTHESIDRLLFTLCCEALSAAHRSYFESDKASQEMLNYAVACAEALLDEGANALEVSTSLNPISPILPCDFQSFTPREFIESYMCEAKNMSIYPQLNRLRNRLQQQEYLQIKKKACNTDTVN